MSFWEGGECGARSEPPCQKSNGTQYFVQLRDTDDCHPWRVGLKSTVVLLHVLIPSLVLRVLNHRSYLVMDEDDAQAVDRAIVARTKS